MNLPRTAAAWTRADAPRRIDATSIFSYMDGAGELYIGLRTTDDEPNYGTRGHFGVGDGTSV